MFVAVTVASGKTVSESGEEREDPGVASPPVEEGPRKDAGVRWEDSIGKATAKQEDACVVERVGLRGRVVARNRPNVYVLADGTGRLMVNAGPAASHTVRLALGERVEVVGLLKCHCQPGLVDEQSWELILEKVAFEDGTELEIPEGSDRESAASGDWLDDGATPREKRGRKWMPIGQVREEGSYDQKVTIRGRVIRHEEDNEFKVADGTGAILVDAGPGWYRRIRPPLGSVVEVEGEVDFAKSGEREIDAFRLLCEVLGDVRVRGEGRPPWAGGPFEEDEEDDD